MYKIESTTQRLGSCAEQHKLLIKDCKIEQDAVDFALAWARENRVAFQKLTVKPDGKDFVAWVLQDSGD